MWYLALTPPQHFQGKTWPGSEGWLVPPLVPPDPEPTTRNRRNHHVHGVATHSLFHAHYVFINNVYTAVTRPVKRDNHLPSSPFSAKQPCPWRCTGAQKTTSPSDPEFGTPSQKGLFLSIWPEAHVVSHVSVSYKFLQKMLHYQNVLKKKHYEISKC